MLDQYSNRHLIEVNCGFQFPQETLSWDSTFFGQYYDKIKSEGFAEKQERKGVQITFNNLNNNSQIPFTSSEVEDQVIFKNTKKGWAIAMGKGKISFHVVQDYTNWNDFINSFISPFFTFYTDLGLGNGIRNCNIVYLNRFVKPVKEKLSNCFTIISDIDDRFGIETNTSLQRIIQSDATLLIAKLNSQIQSNGVNINLECGAICKSLICMNKDWFNQANDTHEPIRDFFESLITPKLRKEL
jgi:uncharacterized protein (TIGR04255 family)